MWDTQGELGGSARARWKNRNSSLKKEKNTTLKCCPHCLADRWKTLTVNKESDKGEFLSMRLMMMEYQNRQWKYPLTLTVCVSQPDISFSSVPQSSTVWLKTHQWATLLHWVTRSAITMNTHTVVYFDSIPHTPSCCQGYSPEHQVCINPQLKIIPKKCTI